MGKEAIVSLCFMGDHITSIKFHSRNFINGSLSTDMTLQILRVANIYLTYPTIPQPPATWAEYKINTCYFMKLESLGNSNSVVRAQ